ncbi:hypothetical protein G6F50_014981 [Rhizopus delemar]|uniref:Aromatic-ring-hydroxylating dioxygenase alpha subunit C-terminal domain-containing protein n=1 Tax=Rhizopus delemar TaxID=936053 RepID=A0A9P6Y186_9FUNG|nr:hypothetical protein G6F50_014981 [Rhizopus delemar]
MNLQKFRLRDCHGLLFEGPRDPASDMAPLFSRPEFNFGDYVLDHVEVHQCNYNWKTFIEVYLEDYHVGPFHPGLGRFVTCDDLTWEFNDWYSLQKVGVHNALAQPGSDVYKHVGHVFPDPHDRALSARAGAVHAVSEEPAGNRQRRRVLLPRGNLGVRTRIRRGATRRLHGNGHRRR